MKTTFALLAVLAWASCSYAAIEFSEDEVGIRSEAGVPGTSVGGVNSNTGGPSGGGAPAPMGALSQAQSSGAAGSVGSSSGSGQGEAGAGGGGGGGEPTDDDGNGPTPQLAAFPANGDIGNNAVPEPMTLAVWSLLVVLGVGMVRVFRR